MVRKIALTLAVIAVASLSLAAQTGNHVQTPSVWQVDLPSSDFGGSPPPKSDTLYMEKDTDEWLSWRDVTVDDSGQTATISWSGVPDGTLKPVTGSHDTAGYQNNGDAHWQLAAGGTVDCKFALSDDKMKATMTCTYLGKSGNEAHYKTVYVRTDKKSDM